MTQQAEHKTRPKTEEPVTVADSILEMVLSGELLSGDWLREADLADKLGTSRTPVRDALKQLIGSGVLLMEPNRGVRIRSYTTSEIEEIYRARSLVEPYVLAASIPHITPEDIELLRGLSQRMRQLSADQNRRQEVTKLNLQLHNFFVDKIPHHPLAPAAKNLMIPIIVSQVMVSYSPTMASSSMDHHDDIISAAEVRDADWAASIMRTHILSGLNNFKRANSQG